MAFCVECGADVGDNKFCGSCGKAVSDSNPKVPKQSEAKPKGNIKTDPDQQCVKCGGSEFYTNWHNNDLADLCASCDIPMGLTESGRKKQRNTLLWPVGIVTVLGLIFIVWMAGGFDSPKAESEPVSTAQPADQPEEKDGISYTHCSNLIADLGVFNDMVDVGDLDLVGTALALIAQDADNYAKSYSGEINHDLQILADRAREFEAWLETDRSAEVPDIATAYEKVLDTHCH